MTVVLLAKCTLSPASDKHKKVIIFWTYVVWKFIHFTDLLCYIHTIWLCVWSSHMNNQSECQLVYYGEEIRQW